MDHDSVDDEMDIKKPTTTLVTEIKTTTATKTTLPTKELQGSTKELPERKKTNITRNNSANKSGRRGGFCKGKIIY